jgi:hypothetical protein
MDELKQALSDIRTEINKAAKDEIIRTRGVKE